MIFWPESDSIVILLFGDVDIWVKTDNVKIGLITEIFPICNFHEPLCGCDQEQQPKQHTDDDGPAGAELPNISLSICTAQYSVQSQYTTCTVHTCAW